MSYSQELADVERERDALKAEVSRLTAELVGIGRFLSGSKPGVSTSIADQVTYGYGKLDANGFWEHPVPERLVQFERAARADERRKIAREIVAPLLKRIGAPEGVARDWACVKCRPNSDMLRDGMLCDYHAAERWCAEVREQGGAPHCAECGMPKKPIGRDAGAAAANGYCVDECPGYRKEPHPGYLWPGEQGGE